MYNGMPRVGLNEPLSATQHNCWMDVNSNGVLDVTDMTSPAGYQTTTTFDTITPESCCSLTPNGPHVNIPDVSNPTAGADFSTALKKRIRNQMKITSTFQLPMGVSAGWWSALGGNSPVMTTAGIPFRDFHEKLFNPGGSTPNLTWEPRPQVDHIIPRVDIKGCDCGTNSITNAILVSAEVNNQMQNYCVDDGTPGAKKKAALIAFFAQ